MSNVVKGLKDNFSLVFQTVGALIGFMKSAPYPENGIRPTIVCRNIGFTFDLSGINPVLMEKVKVLCGLSFFVEWGGEVVELMLLNSRNPKFRWFGPVVGKANLETMAKACEFLGISLSKIRDKKPKKYNYQVSRQDLVDELMAEGSADNKETATEMVHNAFMNVDVVCTPINLVQKVRDEGGEIFIISPTTDSFKFLNDVVIAGAVVDPMIERIVEGTPVFSEGPAIMEFLHKLNRTRMKHGGFKIKFGTDEVVTES